MDTVGMEYLFPLALTKPFHYNPIQFPSRSLNCNNMLGKGLIPIIFLPKVCFNLLKYQSMVYYSCVELGFKNIPEVPYGYRWYGVLISTSAH